MHKRRAQAFQYPLADRRRCNYRSHSIAVFAPRRFSILLRIVGDVTATAQAVAADLCRFSILLRIVGDVTSIDPAIRQEIAERFSILLRIVGDVTAASASSTRCTRCFSILLRIVGDVTNVVTPDGHNVCAFQYPLADRRRCNPVRPRFRGQPPAVSVSSCGS